MSVNFKKRVGAYLIDFLIFMVITVVFAMIIPSSSKLKELDQNLAHLQEDLLKQELTTSQYLEKYRDIIQDYDKENINVNICNLVFILGYFVIIPVFHNGQTIGKKIFKIKVSKQNGLLTIRDMIIRNFITTSLFQLMISSIFVYVLPKKMYFSVINIVGILQILLVIITAFMIIYRKDKKGIQDLITNTEVIEV